ncbi:hypothetical protein Tco_0870580, partial [Tanacetum coccineum]
MTLREAKRSKKDGELDEPLSVSLLNTIQGFLQLANCGEGGGGMFGGDVESGGEVLIVMLLVGVMYSGVVGGEDGAVEGGDDGVVLVEVELMGSYDVEGLEGVFGAG